MTTNGTFIYTSLKDVPDKSMENAVFSDVAPCRSCVNRRFGGKYCVHHQGRKICERRTSLQPPAHDGSSLADSSTLKMEAVRSSETSVHTRSTRRHIPEDGILHSRRRENLKSYLDKSSLNSRLTNICTLHVLKSEAT
jgi:hypothetical protein